MRNDNAINPTVQMQITLKLNYWNEILIVAKLTSYQTHMEKTMWLSDKTATANGKNWTFLSAFQLLSSRENICVILY